MKAQKLQAIHVRSRLGIAALALCLGACTITDEPADEPAPEVVTDPSCPPFSFEPIEEVGTIIVATGWLRFVNAHLSFGLVEAGEACPAQLDGASDSVSGSTVYDASGGCEASTGTRFSGVITRTWEVRDDGVVAEEWTTTGWEAHSTRNLFSEVRFAGRYAQTQLVEPDGRPTFIDEVWSGELLTLWADPQYPTNIAYPTGLNATEYHYHQELLGQGAWSHYFSWDAEIPCGEPLSGVMDFIEYEDQCTIGRSAYEGLMRFTSSATELVLDMADDLSCSACFAYSRDGVPADDRICMPF